MKNEDIKKLWFTPPFYEWALDMESLIYIRDLYNEFLISQCVSENIKCFYLPTIYNSKESKRDEPPLTPSMPSSEPMNKGQNLSKSGKMT